MSQASCSTAVLIVQLLIVQRRAQLPAYSKSSAAIFSSTVLTEQQVSLCQKCGVTGKSLGTELQMRKAISLQVVM